jgi:iron complex outermembrane receptor protein
VRALADVRSERARNVSLDLTARRGPIELNASTFATDHDRAALLTEPTLDASGFPRVSVTNTTAPSRTRGIETYAFYSREPLTITADYAWLDATEVEPGATTRTEVPLTPRHSAALDVAWEEDETGTRIGVEVFYSGAMRLEHDPYRSTSAPFATVGVLAAQRVGRVQLFVDGENLGNVRQASYEPTLLPAPDAAGRIAVDAWAPREGRVVNGGIRFDF